MTRSLGFAPLARRQAQSFYVAPTGSETGDGSMDHPWDLQTALGHPPMLRPGDTIWLRGGRYTGPPHNPGAYVVTLRGTAGSNIVVRGMPGERAIIDGNRADHT